MAPVPPVAAVLPPTLDVSPVPDAPPDVAPVPAVPPEPPAPWLSVPAEQLIARSAVLTRLTNKRAIRASIPRRCVFTDQSWKRTYIWSSDFLSICLRCTFAGLGAQPPRLASILACGSLAGTASITVLEPVPDRGAVGRHHRIDQH